MAEKLSLRVTLALQERVLGPLKRIQAGSGDTAKALKAASDKLKELNKAERDVSGYRQTRVALRQQTAQLQAVQAKSTQYSATLEDQRTRHVNITASLRAAKHAYNQVTTAYQDGKIQGAEYTRQIELTRITLLSNQQAHERSLASINKYKAQVKNAGDRVAGLTQSIKGGTERLAGYKTRLDAAGIDTARLGMHSRTLKGNIEATTASIERQKEALRVLGAHQRRVATVKAAQQGNVAARGQARGALFDGVALAASLAAPMKMAVEFESSMADVAKVMDFGDDKNGLSKMSRSAIELSKRLPMAAKDIAQIMALGGQSGLGANEILGANGGVGFAEHAVKMGTAFNMTAEESGDAMAKMKSAFGMSIPEVATLTDKINLLGNTGAANEKQILNIVTRVGPLGGVAGVAASEIAALGSTLAGMGVQEDVAATGIQNFMLALTSGASATKKQREMLKSLGLESTAVAKTMQSDATGTMLKVLESVNKLPKHTQAAALAELFGKESIKAIAPMLTQLDTLKESFKKVGDTTRYAGAVEKEYAARAATTANQLQLTKNQAAAMGITLGNVMLPALNDTLAALMPWLDKLSELAQTYPGVTKAIVMGTAALVLFKIAAIAGAYGMTFIKGALLATQGALLAARAGWLLHTGAMVAGTHAGWAAVAVSKALTAGQWLWNAAIAANPIGIVIAAIVLMVAAGVLLWRNWDSVVAGGKALWGDFTTWLSALWGKTKSGAIAAWTDLTTWLGGIWDGIVEKAASIWGRIIATISNLPEQFRSFGGFVVDGLINGITSRAAALRDAVVGIASSVGQWFKEKLGINSPSRVFMEYGGWISEGAALGIAGGQGAVRNAALGMATAATLAMPMAANAAALQLDTRPPLGASAAAAPGGSGGNTYTITINPAPGMDAQAIARAVTAELDRRERSKQSARLSRMGDID